jgi:hypothetical protein
MLARRLLEDPSIPARERVAAILVAFYAQPIVRVARLTIDQITVSETETAIRFAETPVTLPERAAIAVRAWLDQRQAQCHRSPSRRRGCSLGTRRHARSASNGSAAG